MSALDIDSMRALTVIAETGGITRAAKRLNLSQSAVTHQIRLVDHATDFYLYLQSWIFGKSKTAAMVLLT